MRFAPQRRAIFEHRNFKKWPESGVLRILTYTCTSRHRSLQFLRIETSKIGPSMRCFVHFDLQICFSPQRRATFGHLTFKKGSDRVVFYTFCLENVLRATAAFHFSSVCKNRYLRTCRFTEPTFRTSGSTNHLKNTAIPDVPNISRTCAFFLVALHAC